MSDIQYPENGKKNVNLKSTDLCGNTRNGVREVNIIQRLLEGQYISILEDGDQATISADVSADYYNKAQINELLGDLDTVKFKVVSALPAIGAENVIYLVAKTAPDTGYDQYIWDVEDTVFYPIGDTDIDLSDYYTKTQSDTKFQQKLTRAQDITTLSESTEFSQVDLANNMVHKIAPGAIWNYIKTKFTAGMVYPITDNTRISGLDLTQTNVNQYFSASSLFSYIMDKIGTEDVSSMTDSTAVADFFPTATNQVKRVTGSVIWTYIKSKLTADNLTSISDSTKIGSVDNSKTNVVQQFTASVLFQYMWKKIYPVGCIYQSTSSTSPATLFGGTWTQVDDGYYLRASTSGGGNTLGEELPNVKGQTALELAANQAQNGALKIVKQSGNREPNWSGSSSWGTLYLDASKMTNSVYKDNGKVQPKSFKVYTWYRTA